jgi:hypothetical protein
MNYMKFFGDPILVFSSFLLVDNDVYVYEIIGVSTYIGNFVWQIRINVADILWDC